MSCNCRARNANIIALFSLIRQMVYVEMGFESSPWPEIEISLAINLAHHK